MTKRRYIDISEDGLAFRVPVGDDHCHGTALVSARSMVALVEEYGEKSFFLPNERQSVSIEWKGRHRPVWQLILKVDSDHRVKYVDGDKFNLIDENLLAIPKKNPTVVRRYNGISSVRYIDPVATGLMYDPEQLPNEVFQSGYTANGEHIPDLEDLTKDGKPQDKDRFFVESFRAFANATRPEFKQKKLEELHQLFEFQYKKKPSEAPELFLQLSKKYDERLTMEQLKRWGALP